MASAAEAPVIGVIPHYGTDTATLPNLIEQMGERGYGEIFVLDDCTPKGDPQDAFMAAIKPYGSNITVVHGTENIGAGGNRNRILDPAVHRRKLGSAILHFVDADMSFANVTEAAPTDTLRELLQNPESFAIGAAGGLVLAAANRQHAFNYGPAFTVHAHIAGVLQERVEKLVAANELEQAERYYRRYNYWLQEYPNLVAKPHAKDTYWLIESNFGIRFDVLQAIGGFPAWRFHEAQDVAHKLEANGLRRRFDPDPNLTMIHGKTKPRSAYAKAQASASLRLIQDYGLRRFLWGSHSSQVGKRSSSQEVPDL